MAFILGLNHKLYIQTGFIDPSPWPAFGTPPGLVEADLVSNLTLNGEAATADVSTRRGAGFRQTAATLNDVSIEFEVLYDTADAAFAFLMDAFENKTIFGAAVLDGDKDTTGTEGFWMYGVVTSFQKAEELEDAGRVSVTITSTRTDPIVGEGGDDAVSSPAAVTADSAGFAWTYGYGQPFDLTIQVTNSVGWTFDPGTGDATTVSSGTGLDQSLTHDYSSNDAGVYYPTLAVPRADILKLSNEDDDNPIFSSLPSLEGMTGLVEFYMNNAFPNGSIVPDFSDCTAITTISLFTTATNKYFGPCDLTANTALTTFYADYQGGTDGTDASIPFPSFPTSIQDIQINGGNAAGKGITGSVPSVASFTSLATLELTSAPRLTGWAGSSVPATLTSVSFAGCALTQAAVDAILAQLDTAGASGGTCSLHLGTNAIPSASGLTSKSNLEGKSWTVNVNS